MFRMQVINYVASIIKSIIQYVFLKNSFKYIYYIAHLTLIKFIVRSIDFSLQVFAFIYLFFHVFACMI